MATDFATLLTPPGSGAIAVVRISGPGVEPFLQSHFKATPAIGRCVHGDLFDGDRLIDDAVVVLSNNGATADLNVHAGPWVVRSVLELTSRCGFADPNAGSTDNFSIASVDGVDLIESEMLAALPLAQTELALRVLLSQPAVWRAFLATIDGRREQVRSILADRSLHWLLHPPTVAIVGAPNVGKSTLANQLFGQERSITADLPGTTRDWIGETANLDGLAITLLDTPGVRATEDAIEHAAIQQAAEPIRRADLILLVLDASAPEEPQRGLADLYPNAIRVINKIDRSIGWHGEGSDMVETSALAGDGIDDLRRALRSRFQCDDIGAERPRWWTERQRAVLAEMLDYAQASFRN